MAGLCKGGNEPAGSLNARIRTGFVHEKPNLAANCEGNSRVIAAAERDTVRSVNQALPEVDLRQIHAAEERSFFLSKAENDFY
ncbi:hypothetical protein ANN_26078 [Periplaneta americana]|uniref:Uncharacterized protein n=1 Tax=Periplaneta americana TaxID=6978 RepID=A0ABQ8S5B1_PERAM|nr:hypothetical protein ANN_26078 [Periplaneta americana]